MKTIRLSIGKVIVHKPMKISEEGSIISASVMHVNETRVIEVTDKQFMSIIKRRSYKVGINRDSYYRVWAVDADGNGRAALIKKVRRY